MVLVGAVTPTSVSAQSDSPLQLAFLDIPAGATVAEVRARVREGDGSLSCATARNDARVQDCRGNFIGDEGANVEVWLSAIDGTVGILTLSAPLDNNLLEAWRDDARTRYGQVGARAQGTQWTEEWIRQGQMLRIVWRTDGGQKRISVSLVDGATLDGWRPKVAVRKQPARRAAPVVNEAPVTRSDEPPLERP